MTTMVREEPAPIVTSAAARHVAASNDVCEQFFTSEADAIARACQAMALRFQRGGRLLVHATASEQSDVAHVVVEFVHPVIVGKRALPAMAVRDASAFETLSTDKDILLLLSSLELDPSQARMQARARSRGLLTVSLTGRAARPATDADDFVFAVPSEDACVVQEAHEMLYHILWELVHVFFEHRPVRT